MSRSERRAFLQICRPALLVSLAMALAVQAAPSPPTGATTSATLRWQNGETVSGELVGASEKAAIWKTTLFEDPLVLGWHALRRVDKSHAAVPVTEPFSFALRDGSYLHGELLSISDQEVAIHSARHGETILKRSEVLSVRRLRGGKLILAGPTGDGGWSALPEPNKSTPRANAVTPGPAVAPLLTGPGGALVLPYFNRSASLALPLPQLVDVEFRVRSSMRPDFLFALDAGAKPRIRIETWGEELVLASPEQFKPIRKLAEDEREVALRVCWDRTSGRCVVFSPAGEMLVDWQAAENKAPKSSGLLVHGKGRDLSLEFLRVRAWDGPSPPKIDPQQPRIEMANGNILAATVQSSARGAVLLHARGEHGSLSVPLNEVDALYFSADRPQVSEQPATLAFADATLLMGRIGSIKDGRVALATSFTDQPLTARIDSLRQLRVKVAAPEGASPELPLEELDKLVLQQTTLHGKLTGGGEEQPRWLPVGGETSSIFDLQFAGEITRAMPPNGDLPTAPALFYTSSGDVLPGELRTVDASGVELASNIIETTRLPAEQLEAIQFGAATQRNLQGFADAGWRIVKGDERMVRRTGDKLEMDPGTAFGHPDALQSSELEFTLPPINNFTTLRLRMFCAGTDPAKSVSLILSHWNTQLTAGIETKGDEQEHQFQTRVVPGKPIKVRLVLNGKQVEMHVNEVLGRKFNFAADKRAGVGLIIEPATSFGNPVQPIAMSGFAMRSVPGRTWLPEVNEETKQQTLTVPRFRKDSPPRHALLAMNGDVLRGEIEAATATHFGFRSGLENLRVPRDRVKAAIWLKKAAEGAPPPPSTKQHPVLKRLEQNISTRSHYSGSGLSSLISFLQHEAADLKFKLPGNQDGRRYQMQFGDQTIGEALEQICELFALRYRVEDDGTIVLEAPPEIAKDQLQKVYRLKEDAFADVSSVQDLLVKKGMDFPKGATALWQPKEQQLAVTNTAANHAKLEKLLAAEFGGNLGSPTHWLLLTSGARLGLAVEKFEPDFILGRHPVYGRCKVPMNQLYVLRTSIPEPTAARKQLDDWQLVFAPEPVLPETGGESSPLLGKEAKPFKLPLLSGGDFDLAKEKGKVVVLDFWATWCGPCIKALPPLMEAMSAFPTDRVRLIGINQSEPAEQVKRFLEARDWTLTVAMDAGQSVARQFGVEGIPHTVIVGPDGKVAWVKTGYSAEGNVEAANAVKQLLAAP